MGGAIIPHTQTPLELCGCDDRLGIRHFDSSRMDATMAQRPSLPPLVQAHATLLLTAPALIALPHVVGLISAFLDGSAHVSLPQAASNGSTWLMERVATRLTQDQQLSQAMLDHWFARALQVAIEKNDLDMAQKVHTLHPEPLVLNSLELAMQHGMLELVQWVVEHRHDRLCSAPGIKNLCTQCAFKAVRLLGKQDSLRVVQWLLDEGVPFTLDNDGYMLSPLHRVLLENLALVQWYDARGLLSQEKKERLLESAISSERINAVDVAAYLVGSGLTLPEADLISMLMRGACQRHKEPVMELVLSSRLCDSFRHNFKYEATRPDGAKVFQWSHEFVSQEANSLPVHQLAFYAYHFVHVDTAQWLFEAHAEHPVEVPVRRPSTQEDLLLLYQWMKATGLANWTPHEMNTAARVGNLEAVQWLHTNSDAGCTPLAMDSAAANGHLAVVEWLHHNRTEGCTSAATKNSASNGHLHVVKWLYENRSEHITRDATVGAIRQGQLEVLEWLYRNQPVECVSCVTHSVLNAAVGSGAALNAVKWLQEQPPTPPCIGRCYGPRSRPCWLGEDAAECGDLQLLQYLCESFPESLPNGDQDEMMKLSRQAGRGGHLPLIQWLYTDKREQVDWEALRGAVSAAHSHIVAWLDDDTDT